MRLSQIPFLAAGITVLAVNLAPGADPAAPAVDFEREIRPLLSNHCFQCHGPDVGTRKGDLRLDNRSDVFGESGHAALIVPGDTAGSELFQRISSTDPETRMPPADSPYEPLSGEQVELFRRWIDSGAAWKQHWAFVTPTRPALPDVAGSTWPVNPIDAFTLAAMRARDFEPSREASKETLIRRITLDLTGLPPTLAEVDAFLADDSPNACDRVVDRLLQSTRFGERMAVDWLDAARYADTHGYHIDSARDMTHWREWVINAFNTNMPFDQFTVEQVAGDLLPNATIEQKIASGFNRNHMINYEGGAIPDEYHTAYIVDRVSTFGSVWLGLTIGCAQCHDHKFDPISQREFYGLYAFFHNVPEKGLDGRDGNATPVLKLPSPQQSEELARLETAIPLLDAQLMAPSDMLDAAQQEWEQGFAGASLDAVPESIRDILKIAAGERSAAQQSELQRYYRAEIAPDLRELSASLKKAREDRKNLEAAIPTAMVMEEMPQPRDTFVLVRGQYDKKGDQVTAAIPAAFPPLAEGAPANRLGLAQWLVSPAQPLTARVIVNRYWQTFFGSGLVKTSEDFGSQGALPSHPELLDWLASEFMHGSESGANAWDVKALVRLIVTSATYRQSSAVSPAVYALDPENRLLARGPRFRLQAEFIRDQALAVSGLLNPKIGGQSVSPYQPAGLWEELMSREDGDRFSAQTYVQSHGPDLYRRTMYTFWKRTCPPPTLATFDAPDREVCTVRRARTNTPLQALVLLNDPTYVEAARKLAERILGPDGGDSIESRLAFALRVVTGRRPGAPELGILRDVLDGQLAKYHDDREAAEKLLAVGESPRDPSFDVGELAAWTTVASAVLNLDETVTRN